MLIHNDKHIYRFRYLKRAKLYAVDNCRGNYEFYIVIDTEKDEVVCKWCY